MYIDKIDDSLWDVADNFYEMQSRLERFIYNKPSCGTTWMFHCISNDRSEWYNSEYSITLKTFEELIQIYKEHGYSFKSVEQLFSGDEKSIYVTFDDGFRELASGVLSISKEYSIPICVFITADYIGKENYIDEIDIKRLSKEELFTIGGHTLSHPILRDISYDAAKKEIVGSISYLEKIIEKKINVFAYPYGSIATVSGKNISVLRNSEIEMAFSTLQTHNIKDEGARYFQPRVNINESVALEMIAKLKNDEIFIPEKKIFEALKNDYYKKFLLNWISKLQKGYDLHTWISNHGYKKICIWGTRGDLARKVIDSIVSNAYDYEVVALIDNNRKDEYDEERDLAIINSEEISENVDLIVVIPGYDIDIIRDQANRNNKNKMIGINELVN